MRLLCCAVLFAAFTATAGQAQNWCRHEAQRSATIAIGDARRLVLEAGSGSLRIEGRAGLTNAMLRGRACASDADLLDAITLEARRSGGAVVVRANVRDRSHNFLRDHEYARLDLVVEVPAGMAAEIADGSGDIELSGLGAVNIDDGSGEIVGSDLASVVIEDGSGAIRLSDISGRVSIEDGSGEISLLKIGGAIDIDDGSGEIEIRLARSSVRVSDGSGGIDVVDVEGDFIVDDDGSGRIAYDNVRGKIDIPRKKR